VIGGCGVCGCGCLELLFRFGGEDLSGAAGNLRGCDPGSVLGTDERQIALGLIGAVFGGFELALEASNTGKVLLGHALLFGRD